MLLLTICDCKIKRNFYKLSNNSEKTRFKNVFGSVSEIFLPKLNLIVGKEMRQHMKNINISPWSNINSKFFVAEDELKKMDIVGATSSGEHSTRYKLSNSYDNNDGTFFHSSGNDGFAKYQIEESDVTLVKVQNRPDCCGKNSTTNSVLFLFLSRMLTKLLNWHVSIGSMLT